MRLLQDDLRREGGANHGSGGAGLRRRLGSDQQGFTLVELLIVLQILAILVLSATPAYVQHRQTAQDTVAKTDAAALARFVEAARRSGEGSATATRSPRSRRPSASA